MERDFAGYLTDHARALDRPTLTHRQLSVVFLSSHGMSYRQMGETLYLTEDTCRKAVQSARRALEARTPAHAVATALRLGLIE